MLAVPLQLPEGGARVTAPWEFAGKLVTEPIPLVGSDTSNLLNTTRAGVVELATASVAELDRRLVALREHARGLTSEVESLKAQGLQFQRLSGNLDEVEEALLTRASICDVLGKNGGGAYYRDALQGVRLARKESA
jgi:hypothetical protein